MNTINPLHIIIIVVLSLSVFFGCEKDEVAVVQPKTPEVADYPKIVRFSQARLDSFYQTVELFHQAYQAMPTYVDSVLCIAEYGNSNVFDLTPSDPELLTSETVVDTLFKFFSLWGSLFNVSPYEITLESNTYSLSSSTFRLQYNKSYYYPNGHETYEYGYLRVEIKSNGYVQWITGNCAPKFAIPQNRNISISQALDAIHGKELRYYDWGGEKKVILTPSIMEKAVVTPYLIRHYNYESSILSTFEYRLCWKFTFPVFNVYVDAITGEDINYSEQYMVFFIK